MILRFVPRALACAILALTAAAPLAAQRIKLPLSRQELEARAQRDSLDAAAHYNLALAQWNEKKYDEAERSLRTALGLEPRFAPALLAIAYLPYARQPKLWDYEGQDRMPDSVRARLEEVRRHIRHAYVVDPLVSTAIVGAVTPKKSSIWEAYSDAQDYYDTFFQGFDDLNNGEYPTAFRRFDELVELYRDNFSRDLHKAPEVWVWSRAIAATHLQKYDVALRDFNVLLDNSLAEERKDELKHLPMRTNEFRYLIATVQQRAGNTAEARRLFTEVAANDIGLYMAHVRLADIAEAERSYDEAIAARRRAIEVNPDDPSLLTDLGMTLGKAGRFGAAIATLQQAHEANPRDPRPLFLLGIGHVQMGDAPKAREALERFLAMAPERMERQVIAARQRLASLR